MILYQRAFCCALGNTQFCSSLLQTTSATNCTCSDHFFPEQINPKCPQTNWSRRAPNPQNAAPWFLHALQAKNLVTVEVRLAVCLDAVLTIECFVWKRSDFDKLELGKLSILTEHWSRLLQICCGCAGKNNHQVRQTIIWEAALCWNKHIQIYNHSTSANRKALRALSGGISAASKAVMFFFKWTSHILANAGYGVGAICQCLSTLGWHFDHVGTLAHECKSEGQQLCCHTFLGYICQYCEGQHFMRLPSSNTSLELREESCIVRFSPVRISQTTGGTVMLAWCFISVVRLFLGFVLEEERKSDLLVCFCILAAPSHRK